MLYRGKFLYNPLIDQYSDEKWIKIRVFGVHDEIREDTVVNVVVYDRVRRNMAVAWFVSRRKRQLYSVVYGLVRYGSIPSFTMVVMHHLGFFFFAFSNQSLSSL